MSIQFKEEGVPLRGTAENASFEKTMSVKFEEEGVELRRTAGRKSRSVAVDIREAGSVKTARKIIVEYSRDYCNKSGLHGMQYLGELFRPRRDRIFWMLAVIASIVCSVILVREQWIKWRTLPVIVTFAETSTPTWNLPFPAVTICPEVRFANVEYDVFNDLRKPTSEERIQLDYLGLDCEIDVDYERNKTVDEGVFEFLHQNSPKVSDFLLACQWKKKHFNCSEIFTSIITDGGVCYTFNALAVQELFKNDVVLTEGRDGPKLSKHWSLESMYDTTEHNNETYPWRTMTSGNQAGLHFFLRFQNWTNIGICKKSIKGFRMMLHNPAVIPEPSKHSIFFPYNNTVTIAVYPKHLTTSEELRSYSPRDRKCFFQNEKQLRFFRNYTQENCEIECFANFTLKKCECVEYYMPRGDKNTPICGPLMKGCIEEVIEEYYSSLSIHEECNCFATCTELRYKLESSQVEYDTEEHDNPLTHYGRFGIFLREIQIMSIKRSELFGTTDFLANCGGLLGLFLGFRFLSVVEIFYFLSLRLCGNREIA